MNSVTYVFRMKNGDEWRYKVFFNKNEEMEKEDAFIRDVISAREDEDECDAEKIYIIFMFDQNVTLGCGYELYLNGKLIENVDYMWLMRNDICSFHCFSCKK